MPGFFIQLNLKTSSSKSIRLAIRIDDTFVTTKVSKTIAPTPLSSATIPYDARLNPKLRNSRFALKQVLAFHGLSLRFSAAPRSQIGARPYRRRNPLELAEYHLNAQVERTGLALE